MNCRILLGDWFGESKQIASEFLSTLPLSSSSTSGNTGLVDQVAKTIANTQRSGEEIMIVSSVCPAYATDREGKPTYTELTDGLSPNIMVHLENLPKAVNLLRSQGVNARYQVLMADTECDLLPFLHKINLSPDEFIARVQTTVDKISNLGVPTQRFLDYFGAESFYRKYNSIFNKLVNLYEIDESERRKIDSNYQLRKPLIKTLLGDVSEHEGVLHLIRQQAQYTTYAALLRQRFEGRLIAINHQTPNFIAMNHKLARIRVDEDLAKGNFLPVIPLVELNIRTLPQ